MKMRGTIHLPTSHEEKFMIRNFYRPFSKKNIEHASLLKKIKTYILKINKK